MWKKARTLGRGSFGLVSLAISQPNDESKLNLPSLMAVKSTETFQHHSLQKESNLLTELNDCPNILRCYSSFISNDNDNNNVEPIRNFFAALFLANIGMLIHVHILWNHIDILLAAVILVIVIKTLVVATVVKGFRYNNKTSLLVGMSMAQIGEFAFVLLSRASNVHLVEGKLYLLLLGTTALSLVHLSKKEKKKNKKKKNSQGKSLMSEEAEALADDIEEESQIFGEVLRIKKIIDNCHDEKLLEAIREIAIFIYRFHNLDLFQQGWYQIKITSTV